MALIDRIISVVTTLRPRGVLRRETGRTLFLTTDDTFLDPSGPGRVKSYSRLSDVGRDFATASAPYVAAAAYFAQKPYPKNLVIGRWVTAAPDHRLTGGAPGTVDAINNISDGSFALAGVDLAGTDFSGDNTYAEIAATLQAKIRTGTGLNQVTVTFHEGVFVVVIPNGVSGAGFFGAHSSGTGTDVSTLLGLTQAAGARFAAGVAETVSEALDAILLVDNQWSLFGHEASLNGADAQNEIATWIGAHKGIVGALESNEAGATTRGEEASRVARIAARNLNGVALFWSKTADYKGLSLMGRLSSVNFDAAGSLITAMFKSLPGTTPDSLTEDQMDELARKKINYYVDFGADAIVAEGWIGGDAGYIDVQIWADWFENAQQVAVFNLLRGSNLVPSTDFGLARIREVMEAVCRTGVRNGGIAPGQVSEALAGDIRSATGRDDFDGYLTNGYLVHHDQPSSTDPPRTGPPFETYLKGGRPIHKVDLKFTFEE